MKNYLWLGIVISLSAVIFISSFSVKYNDTV